MHERATRAVSAALMMIAAGAAASSPTAEAERWQAMARADLDAIHARITDAHPGVIDPDNPGFKSWLEVGYEQAIAHIPYVVSYDTALAAVRYYTVGFEDGHLIYSDNIREDFPILVTGWYVRWTDGEYRVVTTLPEWRLALPPVGAVWTGCDGRAAEDVLRNVVGPFTDRREGESSRQIRATSLWKQPPLAESLRVCSFRTAAGDSLQLPVAYQPVSTQQFFAALSDVSDGSARAANGFDDADGVLWVRAGNFNLRANSTDREALDTVLAGLRRARGFRAVVFDARGNRGGDSSIGDRIFEAASGGLEFDQSDLDALPRYYARWRVSAHLVDFLDSATDRLTALYGADSPRVADHLAFRDRVVAARVAGESWVEQDAGRKITRDDVTARGGHLRRTDARVALLTDRRCVSACLDFADLVLRVPGVVHVGETTGADSVYMVGSSYELPSGNVLVMPVKVWLNRTRGNNEPLVPAIPVDLDADEASVRRDVLRAIGME